MDLGKMFSDAVGGIAAFFLGAPAEAQPVMRAPQISPVAAPDWREGVPEDAQCAVNVARHFLSPSNPNEVSVSPFRDNGTLLGIDLSVYRSGQVETVGLYWDTPRSREEAPVWSLQHSWDKTTMAGGRPVEFTGYHEHGRVTGYLGGPIGSLFDAEASRFDYTYPAGTQQSREVTPVAVPYLFNAIKTTCDLLS